MTLFDTHAHLDDPRFDEDREALLLALREDGVLCTCVGADMESSARALALAERCPGIWAAVGVHPHEAKAFTEADVPRLTAWLAHARVVALGEIGLDFHYDLSPRPVQRDVFARQLALAHALDMPAILHVREAHGEVTDMLRAAHAASTLPPCVLHCYSGSWESARTYLDMGCVISLAGPVTFKNARSLQEVAAKLPLDRLLIETDSPYLAPVPLRGTRNDPRNVAHVAACIAALRGMPVEALAEAAVRNALAFYRIEDGGTLEAPPPDHRPLSHTNRA